ncbi:MAG: hypothetical protein ACYC7A_20210 [Thermoanaerobaculia bacterium]
MKIKRQPTELEKRSKRGFRGYPVGTIAFYGQDASRASKVAVGIIAEEGGGAIAMKRWHSDTTDVRRDANIGAEVLEFLQEHDARTVVMSGGLMGCPHEEGIDYPEGEVCPACPYWAERDRYTGEKLPEQ